MLTFTHAISCLTTSNLPWFMDITFQVPVQYCALQYRTLLLSPVTYTTVCCFCFGSVSSFFLKLFLHWSPVAYWALTNLGSSSFSVLSFCFFTLLMGFSRQEYWSGLPFPSPVDHILSELSTMTRLSWVALHAVAHSYSELDKVIFCDCGFQSVCPLREKDNESLWKLPEGRDWLRRKLVLVLMGGAMLSKSLIQFFSWWVELCCLPAIYLGRNYGGGNEDNGDIPQKIPCIYCWYSLLPTLHQATTDPPFHWIWNSSTGIPSPPLALFIVMLPYGPLDSTFQDIWL